MGQDGMNDEAQKGALDFKGLILGFSGAAMHHLNAVTSQDSSSNRGHFEMARHNIEIIALLAEKTKGNLTDDEEGIIRQALLDLRLSFIEKTRI